MVEFPPVLGQQIAGIILAAWTCTSIDTSIDLAPQSEAPQTEEKKPPELWPYVTATTGALIVGGGVLLLFSAKSDRNRVLEAQSSGDVVTGVTMRQAADLETSGNQKAAFGLVAAAIGILTIVGTLGWALAAEP